MNEAPRFAWMDRLYIKSPTYQALSEGWDEYFKYITKQGFGYEGSTCPGKQIMMAALIMNVKAQLVYEIGFNAGHMSFRMCKALQETGGKLIAFDLDEEHRSGVEKIKEIFPNVFEACIWGDTRETLPEREETPDVIHIDGGHSYEVVSSDLQESLKRIRPGGFIVLDDCQKESPPWKAVSEQLGIEKVIYMPHIFCYGDAFVIYQAPEKKG